MNRRKFATLVGAGTVLAGRAPAQDAAQIIAPSPDSGDPGRTEDIYSIRES